MPICNKNRNRIFTHAAFYQMIKSVPVPGFQRLQWNRPKRLDPDRTKQQPHSVTYSTRKLGLLMTLSGQ